MFDLCLYLGICALGYIAAIPLRRIADRLAWFSAAQTIAVFLLVFTMGTRIGANDEIVQNLGAYGIYAFFLTVAAMGFSVIAVSVVRRMMGIDRYGHMTSSKEGTDTAKANESTQRQVQAGTADHPHARLRQEPAATSVKQEAAGAETAEQTSGGINRMTLYILALVILGILTGRFLFRRLFPNPGVFDITAGRAIRVELCALLAFVGLDLGLQGELMQEFRSVGIRVLAVPAAVVAGTLAGTFLLGLFLPIGPKSSMAVGAGFGWYSLAAGMLMDAGQMTAGAISFLHNVMREIFSIILIPLVAEKIGYVEAVALPGSPAGDVCLPVIVRATSPGTAVYAFLTGMVLNLMVPILIPLFC